MPPGLRVECDGNPIIGSFDIRRQTERTAAPDAPLVRISGSAFLGSVDVKVVDPDAPGWLDRLTG